MKKINGITTEQKNFLKEFKCVRISSDRKYDDMTVDFECKRNDGLVERLQSKAFNEDKNGEIAHYLIVHDDMPIFYFALKSGSLFTPLEHDLQEMGNEILNQWGTLYPNINITDLSSIVKEVLNQSTYEYPYELVKICDEYDDLCKDVKLEKNTPAIQVMHTYSGIEMVIFCANDNATKLWEKYDIPHTLGKTMFWSKIVPILLRTRRIIGCQYCFLFAADDSPDETLVNYYEADLKFQRITNFGSTKPKYDFRCVSMFCDMRELESHRKRFFNTFNLKEKSYKF